MKGKQYVSLVFGIAVIILGLIVAFSNPETKVGGGYLFAETYTIYPNLMDGLIIILIGVSSVLTSFLIKSEA